MNRMYNKGNFVESCFLNFNKHKQFFICILRVFFKNIHTVII